MHGKSPNAEDAHSGRLCRSPTNCWRSRLQAAVSRRRRAPSTHSFAPLCCCNLVPRLAIRSSPSWSAPLGASRKSKVSWPSCARSRTARQDCATASCPTPKKLRFRGATPSGHDPCRICPPTGRSRRPRARSSAALPTRRHGLSGRPMRRTAASPHQSPPQGYPSSKAYDPCSRHTRNQRLEVRSESRTLHRSHARAAVQRPLHEA